MKIFAIIRRALWSLILAGCIVIGGIYLAVSQTFLTTNGLTAIVKQSQLTDTVREEVLLPKVLASTRSSDYSTLLDDKTVTEAFNATITTDTLTNKLTPAIDSLQSWLNSKQPSIEFSINMSDLSTKFADQLAAKINEKVAALPQCTSRNTMADAENGVCRSPFITKEALAKNINEAIKNDPTLKNNVTITPETVPVPSAAQRGGTDIPEYLNIFYAGSIVAAGIIGLVTIWLLFKHRFAGIITIGAACVIAAIILYTATLVIPHSTTLLTNDTLANKVMFAAIQSLSTAIQQQVLLLTIGGSIAVIFGSVMVIVLGRRRKAHQTMHMSSDN